MGKSDAKGGEPVERPVKPHDIALTRFEALGIDLATVFCTLETRPVRVV